MAISSNLGSSVLKKIFGRTDFTAPNTWYFGLSTKAPKGNNLEEGSEPLLDTGYSRVMIPNTPENFSDVVIDLDAVDGRIVKIYNAKQIIMDEITSGTEPVVTHFFLSSSPTGNDNIFVWGTFDKPRKLFVNSTMIIEPQGAVFSVMNS